MLYVEVAFIYVCYEFNRIELKPKISLKYFSTQSLVLVFAWSRNTYVNSTKYEKLFVYD